MPPRKDHVRTLTPNGGHLRTRVDSNLSEEDEVEARTLASKISVALERILDHLDVIPLEEHLPFIERHELQLMTLRDWTLVLLDHVDDLPTHSDSSQQQRETLAQALKNLARSLSPDLLTTHWAPRASGEVSPGYKVSRVLQIELLALLH